MAGLCLPVSTVSQSYMSYSKCATGLHPVPYSRTVFVHRATEDTEDEYHNNLRDYFYHNIRLLATLRAFPAWSPGYRLYVMVRAMIQMAAAIDMAVEGGDHFSTGKFWYGGSASFREVQPAEFATALGIEHGNFRDQLRYYSHVQQLVLLCDEAHRKGRLVIETIGELEETLRRWTEYDQPLFDHPAAMNNGGPGSHSLRLRLKEIFVSC